MQIPSSLSRRGKTCLLILLLAACAGRALAHNPMTSWAVASLHEDRVELDVELSSESAWTLLGGSPNSPPNVGANLPELKGLAPSLYKVSAGGDELAPTSAEVGLREEDGVGFLLVYPRPAGATLRFDADFLRKLPAGHRTALTLKDAEDKVLRTEVLTAAAPSVETNAGGSTGGAGPPSSFWGFLKLGVEHILTGYDHLLFLLGLLVACRRFKTMALVITCFTLAHSVTLALAALDLVALSPRLVEPLIAASIVFVGVENLLRRDEPSWRWALTLAFGLIHGFGFAGILREAGLGSSGAGLLVPLFAFNLGVEVGQVAVAAVVLPLLWRLRRWPAYERRGQFFISVFVVLAGAYWLLQRLFF
jgi:hydrogenase/urease accessory protein HupE